jgi:hypothetical protein
MMNRRSPLVAAVVILLSACAAGPGPATVPAPQAALHSAPVRFEFHSGFLMNLHHFLYDVARHPEHLAHAPWVQPPTPEELQALNEAADFYRRHYAHSSLLFDPTLARIREALSVLDDERTDPHGLPLPGDLTRVLSQAAPAYARCLWPAHDHANRAWIERVQALNARHGAPIQQGIESALQHPFPAALRDDVVADTGDLNGAYTADDPPHSVLPSERADYGGWAALEMLYHEAAHAGVTDTLQTAIDAEVERQHRAPDHQLWHAAQFEAVGAVVQRVLREQAGVEYLPYARQNGLYSGFWSVYQPLIDGPWDAYLRGQGSFSDAVRAMVAGLPAAQ